MRLTILHFRPGVTQLRIGILIVNLLFSMGVFGYAAYSYYGLTEQETDVTLVPRDVFRYDPKDYRPTNASSAALLQMVGPSLQPKEPPPPPEIDPGAVTAGEADTGTDLTDTEYEPGPLDEKGWEFHAYMLRADPLDTLVVLKKKVDASRPATIIRGSSRLTTRRPPTSRGRTTSRPGVRSPLRPPGARDRVSFLVRERQFTNTDLELDFMIHSADRERFVYWEPEKPGKFFALKYTPRSEYIGSPKKGLRPPPEPEAEGPEAPEEDEKKRLIQVYPRDFEDLREKEYAELLGGAGPGPAFQAMRTGADAGADAGSSGTASSGTPVPTSGTASPRAPRAPTAKEREELKSALKEIAPKMKPEEREQFKKALQGIQKK